VKCVTALGDRAPPGRVTGLRAARTFRIFSTMGSVEKGDLRRADNNHVLDAFFGQKTGLKVDKK
jgi:hypothetical protein